MKQFSEEGKTAMTWLKHNKEPRDEVIQAWNVTHSIRVDSTFKTVSEFLKEWPIILDPRAESLINLDFTKQYPGKETLLICNWKLFFTKVFNIKRMNLPKDTHLLSLLNYLELEDSSEDSKVAIQLTILPHLVPPKGRARIGKSVWKFSTLETTESIIIHCQKPADILTTIEEERRKALNRKIHREVQPYLIVQGEALTNIQNIYIVIDKIHFKCKTTLKGLDTLFKSFMVLKLQYPVQGEHIWQLIQRGVYNINTEHDKIIPYIEDVLNLLTL